MSWERDGTSFFFSSGMVFFRVDGSFSSGTVFFLMEWFLFEWNGSFSSGMLVGSVSSGMVFLNGMVLFPVEWYRAPFSSGIVF